jgi:hypothetical protein
MDRASSTHGGEERCVQGLVRKPEGKRSLGRPRCRWENSVTMDLQEVGWGRGKDLIGLGQDEGVACSSKRGNEPSDPVKFGGFLDS